MLFGFQGVSRARYTAASIVVTRQREFQMCLHRLRQAYVHILRRGSAGLTLALQSVSRG